MRMPETFACFVPLVPLIGESSESLIRVCATPSQASEIAKRERGVRGSVCWNCPGVTKFSWGLEGEYGFVAEHT